MTESDELDIIPAARDSFEEFFSRILSMDVDLSEVAPSLLIEGRGFRGRIGISGEKQGHAEILVPDEYAVLMAACMLGASVQEVEIEHEVPDLLLELLDYLSKNLSKCFSDAGLSCRFSEPGVQVAQNFEIQPRTVGKSLRMLFKHQEHVGLLEVYLEDADTARPADGGQEQAPEEQAQKTTAATQSKSDEPGENAAAGDEVPEGKGSENDAHAQPAPDGEAKPPPTMSPNPGGDVLSMELELEPIDDEDLHGLLETAGPPDDDKASPTTNVPPPAEDGASNVGSSVPEAGAGPDPKAPGEPKPPLGGETQPAGQATRPPAAGGDGGAVHEKPADGSEFQGLSAEDLADMAEVTQSGAHTPPPGDGKLAPEGEAGTQETGRGEDDRRERLPEAIDRNLSRHAAVPPARARKGYRRAAALGGTLLLLAVVAGAAYILRYPLQQHVHRHAEATATLRKVTHPRPAAPQKHLPARARAAAEPPSPEAILQRRLAEAQQLREKILAKQDDILALVQYFENAIFHQRDQIRRQLRKDHLRNFQQAANNEELALALRTIQRQSVSVEALQEPLEWLASASEALDYGIRRTRIDLQMAPYTRGADLQRLAQSIEGLMQKYTINDERLLMNVHQAAPVPVKTIWQDIATGVEKAAWVKSSGTPAAGTRPNLGQWLANRKIWRELCHGDFHRKSNLTMISAPAAACLARAKVQDMFLDRLEELPAAAAYHLARWPGDWLVLNGLTTLSAAAAQQLAKWRGQRLSLNGLKTLSPQAARFLSHWRGRQLELASLSIDHGDDARGVISALKAWRASGGKLFVSQRMQQKIDTADG